MKKININVDEEIWNEFIKICKSKDSTASRELRLYMKEVIEQNK